MMYLDKHILKNLVIIPLTNYSSELGHVTAAVIVQQVVDPYVEIKVILHQHPGVIIFVSIFWSNH